MLSVSLTEPIVSISVNLTLDDAHSFSVSFVTAVDTFEIGSEVTIYRDSATLLIGAVTSYSYDAATKIMNISGIDKTSFADQNDRRETALATDRLESVSSAINSVKPGTVLGCPAISCFGYGTYNGSTQDFVERVANAFGLNWWVNPVGTGYYLTSGDIATPATGTPLYGWGYH
ncbi:hypothetical protein IJT17_00660, partial [bacterium]|nr:hypothetical protein [bacterium]